MIRADIAIIGAGMAGASLAAELAGVARIVLIEREDQPGYHSTGRSAAFWSETYGGPAVQPLTSASGAFLRDGGFLHPRGALHIARAQDVTLLDAFARDYGGSGVVLERLGRTAVEARVPGIRPGWDHAIAEPSCADIDVAALHAHYLTVARRGGVSLLSGAQLLGAVRTGAGWRLETRAGPLVAEILVNAAGAWAGEIARLAGAQPIAITPMRRTVVQLALAPPPFATMPLVIDIAGRFYFKPEAGGRLWVSPHDETPCAPCDASPEEIDVALAIDRLEQAVDWRVTARERAWAGLRSFAPDRAPVYGFDGRAPHFFWCAGQGGFGIQTAPAAARLAAALITGSPPPAGIDAERYVPARFG